MTHLPFDCTAYHEGAHETPLPRFFAGPDHVLSADKRSERARRFRVRYRRLVKALVTLPALVALLAIALLAVQEHRAAEREARLKAELAALKSRTKSPRDTWKCAPLPRPGLWACKDPTKGM